MNSLHELTIDVLRQAVSGGAGAIRAVTRLEPAGGPADKIFPPTYVKDGRSQTKYAMEERRLADGPVQTVLLDSVASQANRIEEALLEGWRLGELPIPVVGVDFRSSEGLEDLELITSLQAPHRIADAILRDGVDSTGMPFRQTEVGRACTDARPNDATGMYSHCPTALIFGVWDSTGPKGGLGAKFQRNLVSEIVGYDVVPGVKTESRIDPLGIEKKAGTIYLAADDDSDWTAFPHEAKLDSKGKPIPFSRKGQGDKGSPATVNHGNIPPSIDHQAGGVTMTHAVQTTVLSLAGLRRLRFRTSTAGSVLADDRRGAAELAARTALAALALAGVTYQRRNGYDLRSRSLLVPCEPLVFEILSNDGEPPARYTLTDARSLLNAALEAARAEEMAWTQDPFLLAPTKKLEHLVRESRKLTIRGEGEEAG